LECGNLRHEQRSQSRVDQAFKLAPFPERVFPCRPIFTGLPGNPAKCFSSYCILMMPDSLLARQYKLCCTAQ
jgi:hypothetical protein